MRPSRSAPIADPGPPVTASTRSNGVLATLFVRSLGDFMRSPMLVALIAARLASSANAAAATGAQGVAGHRPHHLRGRASLIVGFTTDLAWPQIERATTSFMISEAPP